MTGELLGIIQLTVLVALAATLVMLPPGVALAWWLARSRSPLTSIVETLVTLPLVLPPVATGYLLLRLLGRRGLLGGVVDRIGIDVIFTWRALVIAMVVMGLPLVVRTARAGFEQGTRRFEQMAETLGAGPLRVFTISLPLARRSCAAGAARPWRVQRFDRIAGSIQETRTLSLAMYGSGNGPRRRDAAVARFAGHRPRSGLAAQNRLVREGATTPDVGPCAALRMALRQGGCARRGVEGRGRRPVRPSVGQDDAQGAAGLRPRAARIAE
jgi:molybdate transport system permease protein